MTLAQVGQVEEARVDGTAPWRPISEMTTCHWQPLSISPTLPLTNPPASPAASHLVNYIRWLMLTSRRAS